MRILNLTFFACLFCIGITSCSYAQKREETKTFRLPDVPVTLTAPEDRAAYLSLHYWDHFDFIDTSLISRPEITEQAFVDFVSVLPYTPKAQEAVDTLFNRTLAEKEMLYHFIALADKYLYEPNSPMHDEELHILVLRALVNNPRLDEADKLRPRHLLEMALKNRPGDVAADFAVTCRDGRRKCLSEIKAEHTLLYFNDPDCEDCRRVKKQLSVSAVLNGLLESGRLKLLSVCVEGKTDAWEQTTFPARWIDGYDAGRRLTRERVYDLKAMPTLYLLDVSKRVILKDASAERIEKWLSEKNLPQNANGCSR
ncbi:DUF5106 domain-containing protein [Bacteroides thetaiotaomicron]|uniref:DUF5106 domain-containing protein n=1 Tax=Bacteroides thetaiotaomicron TaxID=818 RepID=UPI001F2F197D|nr:DUF5106 domain-containing protein [Bacteroides thetaiotaomicron]